MPLPSATAPALGSHLTELLTDPNVGCTSLNLSRLPDGSFRGTILRSGAEWVKGFGQTPEAAISDLRRNLI